MTRLLRDVSLGALILVLTTAVASAQLSTAELSGRVTDPSGAVLPGVTVTMTQTATRATRTAVTNADGAYVLSNLPTGPYQLEVSLQGFRTYVQTGIVLQVGATPTINAVLALGDLAETVTVEGRRAARGREERRHQGRRRERAHRRAAAAGTPGHRPDRAGRRRRQHG